MAPYAKGQATRARMIEAAYRLAILKGFDRTSVSEIMEAADVQKGTFYHHFPDKDSLGLAVIERDRAEFLAMLEESLDAATPMKSLERFFARALRKHAARRFVGGCLWGNTALEMGDSNPAFAKVVGQVFATWAAKVERVVRAGQNAGEIRNDVPAAALAKSIVAVVEGGIMLSRLTKREGAMKECLSAMRAMLAPAGTSTTKKVKK